MFFLPLASSLYVSKCAHREIVCVAHYKDLKVELLKYLSTA